MRLLLPGAMRDARVFVEGETGVEGAMLAVPPGRYPLPPPPLLPQLRALFAQGFGVRTRWGHVFDHLDVRHPTEPHWYLSSLGVVPEARGRGLGSALLGEFLALADAEGTSCYLETDREVNLPFYEAAGFRTLKESRVVGVSIWHMRRPSASFPEDPHREDGDVRATS